MQTVLAIHPKEVLITRGNSIWVWRLPSNSSGSSPAMVVVDVSRRCFKRSSAAGENFMPMTAGAGVGRHDGFSLCYVGFYRHKFGLGEIQNHLAFLQQVFVVDNDNTLAELKNN
jgi:hypothetical protein